MRPHIRRMVLGLGAALLVGGWGATRYADERQQTISIGVDRLEMWLGHYIPPLGSRIIYGRGVLVMALGAGLIGFGIPRDPQRAAEKKQEAQDD